MMLERALRALADRAAAAGVEMSWGAIGGGMLSDISVEDVRCRVGGEDVCRVGRVVLPKGAGMVLSKRIASMMAEGMELDLDRLAPLLSSLGGGGVFRLPFDKLTIVGANIRTRWGDAAIEKAIVTPDDGGMLVRAKGTCKGHSGKVRASLRIDASSMIVGISGASIEADSVRASIESARIELCAAHT